MPLTSLSDRTLGQLTSPNNDLIAFLHYMLTLCHNSMKFWRYKLLLGILFAYRRNQLHVRGRNINILVYLFLCITYLPRPWCMRLRVAVVCGCYLQTGGTVYDVFGSTFQWPENIYPKLPDKTSSHEDIHSYHLNFEIREQYNLFCWSPQGTFKEWQAFKVN